MRKILLFDFLVFCQLSQSQEEFFGQQTGLTLGFLQGVSHESVGTTAGGFGVHFKNGLTAGIGIAESNSMVSLGYLNTESEVVAHPFKTFYGLSYAYIEGYHVIAPQIGFIKCFFMHYNYPFSIDFSASPQMYLGSSDENIGGSNFVFGLGYKHAIAVNNKVYPVFGLNYTFDVNENKFFSLGIALNCNL